MNGGDLFEQWILYCLDGSTFEEWLAHKSGPDLSRPAGAPIRFVPRPATLVELDLLAKQLYECPPTFGLL